MNIIANSSLCAKYQDDVISIAKKSNYRAIEWDLNFIPATLSEERVLSLQREIKINNLKIRYHLPYSFVDIGHENKEIRIYSSIVIKQHLQFINFLGGDTAIIHIGYFNHSSVTKVLYTARDIAKYANELGVVLCVENLISGFTTNINNLTELLSIDNIYLCLDTGHAIKLCETQTEIVSKLISLIDMVRHAHVYFTEDLNYNHIEFNNSNIYTSEIMMALKKSQCNWFTMELDDYEKQETQKSILESFLK